MPISLNIKYLQKEPSAFLCTLFLNISGIIYVLKMIKQDIGKTQTVRIIF